MNEDNKDFEYIINYFKEQNNKEQQEIYENMKKEHNLLHRLKIIASDKSEIEVIDLQLNIINNKIKTEQDKIKQDKIKHEEQKINEEKISLLKEKLQNYEYANNVLDNLIITSEELINKSEKILNRNATYQEEEELINQINENNSMIRKELNTPIISNLNSLDSLEKNINDTDLEIQNTIKQKLEDSSEKNKTTSPTITTESLYEEFKKRKQLREEKNSMKKNIYDEINKNDVNNTDIDIEYNKKINEHKETINPPIYNNHYSSSLNPYTIYNNDYNKEETNPYNMHNKQPPTFRNPYMMHNNDYERPLNPNFRYSKERIIPPNTNDYREPSNYYTEMRQNQTMYPNRRPNDRLDSLRRLYGFDRPGTPNYRNRPIDNYRRDYEINKEYSDPYSTNNKYSTHFETQGEYINNPQEINREIILIENKDTDNIIKKMFDKLKNNKNEKEIIIYEREEKIYYDKLEKKQKEKFDKIEEKILKLNNINVPLRFRILKSQVPLHTKAMIINKLNDLTSNKLLGGSEISKYTNWVNSLLKVPFKKYRELPINTNTTDKNAIGDYLVNVRKTLDDAVFGHINTKEQITQIIAQWISNPTSVGNCMGIQGVMGNGKTTLVKNGIAKAIDRPFAFITLGGCSDASYLDGHNYTYEGSMWGKIVDVLIECKCMNPVFYFDELDKVSETPKGEEIINTLIHLTDASQNNEYSDKYFNGVTFDLSKSLFIFSFNDKSKINPILLDRLVCIETEKFTTEDKIEITNNYLLNDICSQLDIKKDQYKLSNELIEYIITTYTEDEGGVRSLKKILFNIFSKLNLLNLTKHDKNIKYSFDLDNKELENNEITKKIIDKFIKNNSKDEDLYYKNWYA